MSKIKKKLPKFAEGGDFAPSLQLDPNMQHNGDLMNILGQKHEQGGTPLNTNGGSNPNIEAEHGEVLKDNFIASDNLGYTKDKIPTYNPKDVKTTFADKMKGIENKYKGRADYDNIVSNTKDLELNRVQKDNEVVKEQKSLLEILKGYKNTPQMKYGGYLPLADDGINITPTDSNMNWSNTGTDMNAPQYNPNAGMVQDNSISSEFNPKYGGAIANGAVSGLSGITNYATGKVDGPTAFNQSAIGIANAGISAIPVFGQFYGAARGAAGMVQGALPSDTVVDSTTGKPVTTYKNQATAAFNNFLKPTHEQFIDDFTQASKEHNTGRKVTKIFEGIGDALGLQVSTIAAAANKQPSVLAQNNRPIDTSTYGDGGDIPYRNTPPFINQNNIPTFLPLDQNYDGTKRKKLFDNNNGDSSTESTFGIGPDKNGNYYNIPSVINGKRLSQEEAIKYFEQNGEHTGVYKNQNDADMGAQSREKANIGLGTTNIYKNGGILPKYDTGDYIPITPTDSNMKWNNSEETPYVPMAPTFDPNQDNIPAPNLNPEVKPGRRFNSMALGDALYGGLKAGEIAAKALNIGKLEHQNLYTDNSTITQQQLTPNYNLSYLAYNTAAKGINSLDPQTRAANLANLYSNGLNQINDYNVNIQNQNKALATQYEQRKEGQMQYNNQMRYATDDINARNRAAQRNMVGQVLTDAGRGVDNAYNFRNQAVTNKIGYSTLNNLYPDFKLADYSKLTDAGYSGEIIQSLLKKGINPNDLLKK